MYSSLGKGESPFFLAWLRGWTQLGIGIKVVRTLTAFCRRQPSLSWIYLLGKEDSFPHIPILTALSWTSHGERDLLSPWIAKQKWKKKKGKQNQFTSCSLNWPLEEFLSKSLEDLARCSQKSYKTNPICKEKWICKEDWKTSEIFQNKTVFVTDI